MIIWLASYPKSGNTLIRSLLSSYFFSKDGNFNFEQLTNIKTFPSNGFFEALGIDTSNENEIFKNYIQAQKLINEGKKKKIIFLKTHSSYCKLNNHNFTDDSNTLGVIYIVRDPRNVITSFANHFSKSIEDAANSVLGDMYLMEPGTKCRTHIGKWNFHYNSWKNFKKNKVLLIKYEDLIENREVILKKILNFFGFLTKSNFQIDQKKINNVIKTTSFEEIKKIENEKGFFEAPENKYDGKKKTFFNLGSKNNWKILLDKNIVEKVQLTYKKEMLELGYH